MGVTAPQAGDASPHGAITLSSLLDCQSSVLEYAARAAAEAMRPALAAVTERDGLKASLAVKEVEMVRLRQEEESGAAVVMSPADQLIAASRLEPIV